MPPNSPHLLKLHPDLIERFRNNSNEHVFHQPCQEENHCTKIEHSSPAWQRVYGPVHDKNPTFLWSSLIDSEEAGYCNEKFIEIVGCRVGSDYQIRQNR